VPDVTPISKSSPNRVFNWSAYLRDMYVSAVRASTGAFLAFGGSNAAEAIAPDALHSVGMNWQQAVVAAVSALIFDVVRYINLHPLPPEETQPPFET